MPLVSVVIVNFNGKRYLEACLSTLAAQTFRDFEVIVVDNASQDGSVEHLETQFPWVRVIRNRTNLGFAGGSNEGIRHAHGDFILTLNNDTMAESRFIECLVKPMLSDESAGMCASKMLLPDGRINSAGICLSRSGSAWDRGRFEPDTGQYDRQQEVLGACAGAALYKKKMLDEIGLFDEDFFLYMEDVDLAVRAKLAGWKCIYVPGAVVYHHHGGTAGFGSSLSVYYTNRNVIWYAVKGFPTGLLLASLPWMVARNLAIIPYYALRGKGMIILRSKLDALLGLPRMLKKRKRIVRRIPDREFKRYINTWARIKGR